MESKDLVIKNDDLINSRHELTLAETRIILHMITLINKDDEDFKEHRIQIKDYVEMIDTKAKNEYERAREITKKLLEKVASEVTSHKVNIKISEEIVEEEGKREKEVETALKDPSVQHFMDTFKAQILSVEPITRAKDKE